MPFDKNGLWHDVPIVHVKREHVIIDRMVRQCGRHGDYDAVKWELQPTTPVTPAFWSKCPICNDEIQREQDDAAAARNGTDARSSRLRRMLTEAGFPGRHGDCTLENFSALLPNQKKELQWAKSYAYGFNDALAHGRSAMLLGNPGTGKTHIACAIARHVLTKGATVRFTTAMELLANIKATYHSKSELSTEGVVRGYLKPDLLVIDEVGRHLDSDHDQAQLFRILNERYEEMRPMLLISNLPMKQVVECLGEAVLDRLRERGGGVRIYNWPSQRGEKAE